MHFDGTLYGETSRRRPARPAYVSAYLTVRGLTTPLCFSGSGDSSSESDCESDAEGSTCSSSSDSEVFDVIAEIKRKKAHPDRLHDELWYNDPGQVSPSLSNTTFVVLQNHVLYLFPFGCFFHVNLLLPATHSWCDNLGIIIYCGVVSTSCASAKAFSLYTKAFPSFFTILINKSWYKAVTFKK